MSLHVREIRKHTQYTTTTTIIQSWRMLKSSVDEIEKRELPSHHVSSYRPIEQVQGQCSCLSACPSCYFFSRRAKRVARRAADLTASAREPPLSVSLTRAKRAADLTASEASDPSSLTRAKRATLLLELERSERPSLSHSHASEAIDRPNRERSERATDPTANEASDFPSITLAKRAA